MGVKMRARFGMPTHSPPVAIGTAIALTGVAFRRIALP
jgi:hypothetical protein